MMDSSYPIALVTPVWNDSARLKAFGPKLARALAESRLKVRWIVADDGSSEEEQASLRDLVQELRKVYPSVSLSTLPERSRKGGAIYHAWAQCPDAKWLAFVDADGAIDAASTVHLLRTAGSKQPHSATIGVRANTNGAMVKRSWGRTLSFHIFRTLVRSLINLNFLDTQCGAKVVSAPAFRSIEQNLLERGFVFDVELLLALDQAKVAIEEIPIPWQEKSGGKVHPIQDAFIMLAGLLRIRKRLKRGEYAIML